MSTSDRKDMKSISVPKSVTLDTKIINLNNSPKPPPSNKTDAKDIFVYGDCHGNTTLQVYNVVDDSLMALNVYNPESEDIQENDYLYIKTFVALFEPLIYLSYPTLKTPDGFDKEKFKQIFLENFDKGLASFNDCLRDAKFNPGSIIWVGDTLADRRGCDLLTLIFFKHLHLKKVPFQILISNHDFEFIHFMETGRFSPVNPGSEDLTTISSITTLRWLIDNNLITLDDVKELYNTYYKPHSRLVTYIIPEGSTRPILGEHAPNDLSILVELSTLILSNVSNPNDPQVVSECKNIEELSDKLSKNIATDEQTVQLIEALNIVYLKEFVNKDKVHTLWANGNAFDKLIWSREYAHFKKQSRVDYFHGHTTYAETFTHVSSLDSQAGKSATSSDRVANRLKVRGRSCFELKLTPINSPMMTSKSPDILSETSSQPLSPVSSPVSPAATGVPISPPVSPATSGFFSATSTPANTAAPTSTSAQTGTANDIKHSSPKPTPSDSK